jgi:maltose phosphorylase
MRTSIQAALLDKMDMALHYFTNSRLDLDDYNKEVEEGCHITYGRNMDEHCRRIWWNESKRQSLHFSPKFQKNGKDIPLK